MGELCGWGLWGGGRSLSPYVGDCLATTPAWPATFPRLGKCERLHTTIAIAFKPHTPAPGNARVLAAGEGDSPMQYSRQPPS